MAKQRWIVLVTGITALAFLPASAYAGSGGTPPSAGAGGAGQASAYCCTGPWTQRTIGQDIFRQPIIVFDCLAGASPYTNLPSECTSPGAQVRKCRGDFYTPSAGQVTRCFSP